MGHFRDLPPKGLGVNLSTMEADYVITKDDVITRLSALAEKSEIIYLCTDPDREGEAISWHLRCVLPQEKTFRRATFQEITKKAVCKAIENPGVLNENMVDAQQARRILDRIVGYKLSPELWRSFTGKGSLSAGRVQSVATRLVVDREREIQNFEEQITYKILALWEHGGVKFKGEFKGEWVNSKLKSLKFKDQAKAIEWVEALKGESHVVTDVIHKKQKVSPQAPFTTSNMQAKAANVLKMSASRSMQVAQRLYEGGHITYHRTDSVAISDEAQKASRAWITQEYGEAYCPKRAPKFKKSGGAQEAHECIRPTAISSKVPNGLSQDELKLYQLIWMQFISSQMSPGEDAVTVVKILAGKGLFEARGRTEVFDGFRLLNRTEVQEKSRKKKDEESQEKQVLPALLEKDEPKLEDLSIKEVKTRPPARYSEASLIKKLEKEGIGRPSTYASIVATILKRGYVELEKRKYMATPLGMEITDFLVHRFPRVLDLGFTRVCEQRLDQIGEGEVQYQEFLIKFWDYLRKQLNAPFTPMPTPSKPTSLGAASSKSSKRVSKASPAKEKPSPKSKGEMPCPVCAKASSLEESKKWKGRYFYCCHDCKAYLEADGSGRVLAGDWLKKAST